MVITKDGWRDLCARKLAAAKRLIDQKEWVFAAEVMGCVLECALKAAACKNLNTSSYPPVRTNENGSLLEIKALKTHDFELLLIFSGLGDIFGQSKSPEWSDFTYRYTGVWTEMRYDRSADEKFDEEYVKNLYEILYNKNTSIINQIEEGERW